MCDAAADSTAGVHDTEASYGGAHRGFKLRSGDGTSVEWPLAQGLQCGLLRDMYTDNADVLEEEVQLRMLSARALQLVQQYTAYHADAATPAPQIPVPLPKACLTPYICAFDATFVESVMGPAGACQPLVYELLLAADYLQIEPLTCLLQAAIACALWGKTPAEVVAAACGGADRLTAAVVEQVPDAATKNMDRCICW